MARSQRSGFCRKASGGMRTMGKPTYTGCSTQPMSPMSWYSGSQLTPTESSVLPMIRWMRDSLWSRLAWVSSTPLGSEVEPEVYWMKASESGVTSGGRHSCSTSGTSSSVATHRGAASSGAWRASPSISSRMALVVSTRVAWASRAMARSRGSVRFSRVGSGGYTGTATTPAYSAPKKAAT